MPFAQLPPQVAEKVITNCCPIETLSMIRVKPKYGFTQRISGGCAMHQRLPSLPNSLSTWWRTFLVWGSMSDSEDVQSNGELDPVTRTSPWHKEMLWLWSLGFWAGLCWPDLIFEGWLRNTTTSSNPRRQAWTQLSGSNAQYWLTAFWGLLCPVF